MKTAKFNFYPCSSTSTKRKSASFYENDKQVNEAYFLNNAPVKILLEHRAYEYNKIA